MGPIVEDLVVLTFQFLPAGFHFDQHALRPHEVGVVFSLGSTLLGDAGFPRGPGFLDAFMAEGEEEVVEKISGLAFLVPCQVGLDVGDEVRE